MKIKGPQNNAPDGLVSIGRLLQSRSSAPQPVPWICMYPRMVSLVLKYLNSKISTATGDWNGGCLRRRYLGTKEIGGLANA